MPTSFSVSSAGLRPSKYVLLLALALILVVCSFFVREVLSLQSRTDELRANEGARVALRDTLVDLIDAETGQRGFLLTGDERYLEPYLRARHHVRRTLARAEESLAADPAFQATVRQLMLLTESKFAELERTVLLKKRGDTEAALAVVRSGFGKETMDRARLLIARQVGRQHVSSSATMTELDQRYTRSVALLVVMLAMVVALAIYAWRTLSWAASRNIELATRLAREASHDGLTNLPNRRFFERWAQQLVAKSGREGQPFTLMLIDLDGFKKVNDLYGHAMGDQVLKAATVRFREGLREGEFLARLGGDEFALLIEGAPARADLARLGRRLISSLAPSLHQELPANTVGASIGVAVFPRDGADLTSLTQAADKALYESKENGRSMVSFASSGHVVHARPQETTPVAPA